MSRTTRQTRGKAAATRRTIGGENTARRRRARGGAIAGRSRTSGGAIKEEEATILVFAPGHRHRSIIVGTFPVHELPPAAYDEWHAGDPSAPGAVGQWDERDPAFQGRVEEVAGHGEECQQSHRIACRVDPVGKELVATDGQHLRGVVPGRPCRRDRRGRRRGTRRGLSSPAPGFKLKFTQDVYFGNNVAVVEMDRIFDNIQELVYVDSNIGNTNLKFYGEHFHGHA